jgi:serine/threonine protein kinase
MSAQIEEIFHAVADLPPDRRARYFVEHGIDSSIRSEVEQLLAFDSYSTASLRGNIGDVAQWTLTHVKSKGIRCGQYELTGLVGRGGMGSVYAADRVDGEITHKVAVKLLRPGADHPALRRRFLAERQILAGLSHPNVAKLLDAGHSEDGQPYLVMEYVQGDSVDVHLRDHSIRQKIALFLKVCTAVSYLHRNLVVHRDLKPSNILIGQDGEPKLLDFGIAKMLDLTNDSTVTSMRMLTPEYASPEQVDGRPVTTATDIYSLGVVLYELLTGTSPHQSGGGSAASLALAISSGNIIPPSKLAPIVKGDLEIILMKALRTEPQERYATVDAFADDLSAYLESLPIRARAGNFWYRARKFLRRHWVSAAAVTVVVSSLATGLYIANRQREIANRQRTIAERRFGQLRQLSNRIMDVDRAMRVLPGSLDARRRLVSASLEYLEGLSKEARGNQDLAQEISDGYWRLARIQGGDTEFNLGDSAKAEASLNKADALIETVLAARPHDRGTLFRSAVIAHDRMILASNAKRDAEVLLYARKADARLRVLLTETGPPVRLEGFLSPGDPVKAEREGIASIYANIALAHVNMHLFGEGARYAQLTVALVQSLPASQQVSSKGLSILANALRYQGDLDGALTAIHRARTLAEQAVYPNPTARLFNLYGVLAREGRILGEADQVSLGRPVEAIELLQKALDMVEEVAQQDPNDSASRGRVGTTARELGNILSDRDPKRALAVYDLGIRRLSEVPNSVGARRDRAQLLAASSYPLRRLHRVSEAQAHIDAAIAVLKAAGDYPILKVHLGSFDYAILCAIADQQAETGRVQDAIQSYADLMRKVWASAPTPQTNLTDAVRLSHLYSAVASLDRRAGQQANAYAMASRRLQLWRDWDQKLPKNSFVSRELDAATGSVE